MSELPSAMLGRIDFAHPSGCWLWSGPFNDGGYGRVSIKGRARPVHRVVYEAHRGAVPLGLDLDHVCRVRRCCNPDHLEPVTRRENTLRGAGPAASKAKQTHCINGHELAGANVYTHPTRGTRNCRTCMRATAAARRAGRHATACPCAEPGCGGMSFARGLCQKHDNARRRGSTEAA